MSDNTSNPVKQSVHHAVTSEVEPHHHTSSASTSTSTGTGHHHTSPTSAGGSHVTTSGSLVSSDDPTTNPNASLGQKLKGDVAGAVKGTVGSLQAATGTAIRNKDMENKGLAKMAEEDQRLGAKHGVMPVGSERREEVVDASRVPK